MSIQGIGGGSAASLAVLRLVLRQAQPGGGGGGSGPVAAVPEMLAPDAVMRDIVGRAQFMASLRAASTAVEQVALAIDM